ncbi:MAG: DUF2723 domain-containing protein [Chitinophagaceae bacterium]
MNFKKLNNITGWVICAIACTVYILTAEAGGSLWDCGEFVSCAYKLQIPHPPGAPLFVLLGRFFIILFGDNPLTAAKAVNIMSAVASGFTILFLFWTITHFARKIMGLKATDSLTSFQAFNILGAGVVGALAYTFSDSFWYSAVEGEVYALSSFFTAIVFWAIFKWENALDEFESGVNTSFHPDRWLVFIFFMMGLSIGVHLLNLLAIPAIVMVYYLRKYQTFDLKTIRKYFIWVVIIGGLVGMIAAAWVSNGEKNVILERYPNIAEQGIDPGSTTLASICFLGAALAIGFLYLIEALVPKDKKSYYGGMFIFFVIGCVITGFTQVAVIQYTVKFAGAFDRTFVNNFHLPFFAGFTTFFIVLAGAIWYGLKFAAKKNWQLMRLGLWCVAFVLIGYSTYVTTMIRSNADPVVDMYNVDNPVSLVGYLGREQYGDFPLLYGQKFNARPVTNMETGNKYRKTAKGYEYAGKDSKYVFLPQDKMAFPRMWDISNDQNHADYYAYYLGINKYQDKQTGELKYDDEDGARPNQVDNFKYFMGYQFNWMYFRYFMWNFAGKQNDVQGVFDGNVRDGNWISGIPFIDNALYGDQSKLPDTIKNNKANNKLYLLPFLLGFLGFFYHASRKGGDAFVNFLLFFFTGFAIVIYLNQPGYQPRERDYAYVGSFYAFAVWIGLGVMAVSNFIQKGVKGAAGAALASLLCLVAVPGIMAQQEWDDHDRSKKTIARDLAKNYLESCPPNAVLFSFGDNDTYPLWYAQEVEGIRPDIRVINFSLLGIDWYINQLRYKVNNSPAIDVIFNEEQISGGKRDYVSYKPNPASPENKVVDLYDMLKNYVGSDDPSKMDGSRGDDGFNTFANKNVYIPVDKATVLADKSFKGTEAFEDSVKFSISKNAIYKNDLAVLSILAANKWKRPICFTSYYGGREGLGFDEYLRKEGMIYRVVPFKNPTIQQRFGININIDGMKDVMMNKFAFGNCQIPGVFFDEENRRHLLAIRSAYADLAQALATEGRKEEAKKALDKADSMLNQTNFPYGLVSRGNMHNSSSLRFLEACYSAGHLTLAKKVKDALMVELNQEKAYYKSLGNTRKGENMAADLQETEETIRKVENAENIYKAMNNMPITPSGKDTGK